MHDLPLPRLADHMAAEDRPSDAEEEGKEVKLCRSTPTTPRSTSGTLPCDYDMVMGIAPVEPQEAVRFEEGDNSEFQGAQENTGPSPDPLEETPNPITDTLGSGEFHGGYRSASLRECLDMMAP